MPLTAETATPSEQPSPAPGPAPRARSPWRRLEALLAIGAALLALLFHLRLPTTLPTDEDYRALAQRIASIARPGDVVLLDPHWA